ncbi:MAG: NTP transferase domain-containing protein [Bacteroidia bacterium]|nr:NTP transferase domain-containing protein [Bacteroidia bacterium]
MNSIQNHIINTRTTVKDVLKRLDVLASDAILFLVDDEEKLIGSLTDGDIRRGLINDLDLESNISDFVQGSPKYFRQNEFSLEEMKTWRDNFYRIIPVLDSGDRIIDIVNFRLQKSYLPIDGVIMAGGKGSRLMPLTENLPKPLIKVGEKPIIEYNIDRLKSYGIKNQAITINYLGDQIIEAFGDGSSKGIKLNYTKESLPMGTMGALTLVENLTNDYILVMNSDLLTDIDYEDFFQELISKNGDLAVATTTHEVQIPYGIIESEDDYITDIKEKPTYTYYSNAGIYLFKKELISHIPPDQYFDATSFINLLLEEKKKVIHYPILGYWLDIGKHQDLEKAQRDVHHLKL